MCKIRINETRMKLALLYRMSKESILKLCKKNRLYVTPHLNDVLYLHYQGLLTAICIFSRIYVHTYEQFIHKCIAIGYQKIECLEEYTGLKCLWLESNAISELTGFDTLSQLRCLFIHNNLIKVHALTYHVFIVK